MAIKRKIRCYFQTHKRYSFPFQALKMVKLYESKAEQWRVIFLTVRKGFHLGFAAAACMASLLPSSCNLKLPILKKWPYSSLVAQMPPMAKFCTFTCTPIWGWLQMQWKKRRWQKFYLTCLHTWRWYGLVASIKSYNGANPAQARAGTHVQVSRQNSICDRKPVVYPILLARQQAYYVSVLSYYGRKCEPVFQKHP